MKTLAREQDITDIQQRLKTIRPDCTRRWGRMSPHQMICHLSDSFLAVTGRRHVSMASGPMERTVIKWIALHAPLPWPKGVPTRPEIDQTLAGTPPGDFATDVALLETLFAQFTSEVDSINGLVHPIFGPMSKSDWLRWGYLHMDHHLRQFGC
jgi:uncharacterized protein DUF1569